MATTINGFTPANGIGNCFEQNLVTSFTDLGNGILQRTRRASIPRHRTLVLGDVTLAEAESIAALVLPAGTIVYLTGSFVPAAGALGQSLGFTARIDGNTGRGSAVLRYETFFAVDSGGEIWVEGFL